MEKYRRPMGSLSLFHLSEGKRKSLIITQNAVFTLLPDNFIKTFYSFLFFLFLCLLKSEHCSLGGSAHTLASIWICIHNPKISILYEQLWKLSRKVLSSANVGAQMSWGFHSSSQGYHCLSKKVPSRGYSSVFGDVPTNSNILQLLI